MTPSSTDGVLTVIARAPSSAFGGALVLSASEDGVRAAFGDADGLVMFVERHKTSAPVKLSLGRSFTTGCALTREGRELIAGQKTLTRFDLTTHKKLSKYALREDVSALVETHEGARLWTCDKGGLLRSFDVESGA